MGPGNERGAGNELGARELNSSPTLEIILRMFCAFRQTRQKASCFWVVCSGVTRVDVTRGGNWWVSPNFSLKKIWRLFFFFLVVASESDDLFSCRLPLSSPLPSSHDLYPVFFLNFSHKNTILGRVSPGAVRPPADPVRQSSVWRCGIAVPRISRESGFWPGFGVSLVMELWFRVRSIPWLYIEPSTTWFQPVYTVLGGRATSRVSCHYSYQ